MSGARRFLDLRSVSATAAAVLMGLLGTACGAAQGSDEPLPGRDKITPPPAVVTAIGTRYKAERIARPGAVLEILDLGSSRVVVYYARQVKPENPGKPGAAPSAPPAAQPQNDEPLDLDEDRPRAVVGTLVVATDAHLADARFEVDHLLQLAPKAAEFRDRKTIVLEAKRVYELPQDPVERAKLPNRNLVSLVGYEARTELVPASHTSIENARLPVALVGEHIIRFRDGKTPVDAAGSLYADAASGTLCLRVHRVVELSADAPRP